MTMCALFRVLPGSRRGGSLSIAAADDMREDGVFEDDPSRSASLEADPTEAGPQTNSRLLCKALRNP